MTRTDPELGDVIGERRLKFRHAPGKRLLVALGKPRKREADQDWECPFRIKGTGVNRLEYGYGVDALQALTMALEGIRVQLDRIGEPLAWSGVLPEHTGFHRFIPIPLGPVAAGLEQLVDREASRRLRQLERAHKKQARPAGGSSARKDRRKVPPSGRTQG